MGAARKHKYDGVQFLSHVTSKQDAAINAFLGQQLEYLEAASYDTLTPENEARKFIPIKSDIPKHVTEWKYKTFTKVGQARVIRDYSDDIPRADVYMTESSTPVKTLGSGYGISIDELEAAQATGTNLDAMKAMAAREAIENLIDDLLAFGDASVGLPGFLNQDNANEYTIPAGASTNVEWDDKTPLEIAADVINAYEQVRSTTSRREKPNTALFSPRQMTILKTTPMSDERPDIKVLGYLQELFPDMEFAEWSKLEGAGDGATDRFVLYTRDVRKVAGIIPMEYTAEPPQPHNLEWKVLARAKCGGTHAIYPLSICYADGA